MSGALSGMQGQKDSKKPSITHAPMESETPKSRAKRFVEEKLNEMLWQEALSPKCNMYVLEELLEKGADPNQMMINKANSKMEMGGKSGLSLSSLFLMFAIESEKIMLDDETKRFVYRMIYSSVKDTLLEKCRHNENLREIALIAVSANPKGKEMIEKLLEAGANVNAQYEGYTPLLCAINAGNVEVSKLLLASGAKTILKGPDDRTAIMLAAEKGYYDLCELMLDQRLEFMEIMKGALTIANEEFVKQDMKIGKPPNLAEMLSKKGLLVNSKDKHGRTALTYAIEKGSMRICELLMERGATTSVKDLVTAKQNNHARIYRLVSESLKKDFEKIEKKILAENTSGELQGMIKDTITYSDDAELIKIVIDKSLASAPEYFHKEIIQDSFMAAVSSGNVEVSKMLIGKGVDVNLKKWVEGSERTPLIIAAEKGNFEMCKLLLENDADPNLKNNTNFYPLLAAVPTKPNNKVMWLLYFYGSDISGINVFAMHGALKKMDQWALNAFGNEKDALKFKKSFGKCMNA